MRDYEVSIPIAGIYITTVQASSPQEALDIAFEEADLTVRSDTGEVEQIDLYHQLLRGNVSSLPLNKAHAE